MNRDVDHIQILMANYRNASQLSIKVAILEDLDYYMHQVDNARDFVTLGGLTQIVKPSFAESVSSEIAAKTAILVGSAAQYNPSVQEAVLEAKLLPVILELFSRSESKFCCHELKSRAIYAISSLGKELQIGAYAFFTPNCFCFHGLCLAHE